MCAFRLLIVILGACGATVVTAEEKPPNVPPDLLPLAAEATRSFAKGRNSEAVEIYEKMLKAAPSNLYILSNLGVALYRSGQYAFAKKMLERAIAIYPADSFSHRTLGIVYYSEGKHQDAIDALNRAIAIDFTDALAHNYLGIAASQNGDGGLAEMALARAVALDPGYADAFFNLAVVYATKTPPDRVNGQRCYERAIQLGVEPDESVEKLLNWRAPRSLRKAGDFLTPLEQERRKLPATR